MGTYITRMKESYDFYHFSFKNIPFLNYFKHSRSHFCFDLVFVHPLEMEFLLFRDKC